jgi:hypothetical protein
MVPLRGGSDPGGLPYRSSQSQRELRLGGQRDRPLALLLPTPRHTGISEHPQGAQEAEEAGEAEEQARVDQQ